MHTRTLALALAVAAASCTTDFETKDDTDSESDTTGDVDPDGADALPDGTDVPPDGPPPDSRVVCGIERSAYVVFDGVELENGCISGECYDVSIYVGFGAPNRLVAISGAESTGSGRMGNRFFGAAVDTSSTELNHEPAFELATTIPDGWEVHIKSGSMMRHTPGRVDLLHPRRYHDSSSEVMDQELWSLKAYPHTTGLGMDYEYGRVMNGVPSTETGRINHVTGVATPGGIYAFFAMEEEGPGGPSPAQLYGATLDTSTYNGGGLFGFEVDFVPLQPDRTAIAFPHEPEYAMGQVVLPWIMLQVGMGEMEYHSGLWVIDRPIPSGVAMFSPGMIEFNSSGLYDGNLAGVAAGPEGAYVMAAMASDDPFTMEGFIPPFDVETAVMDDLSVGSVSGTPTYELTHTTMRDMDNTDLRDIRGLWNARLEVFHYLTLVYPEGGNATVQIASYFPDGTPAMDPVEPFPWNSGQWIMPSFDSTIDPESGSIFLANYDDTDEHGMLDGYHITEIVCELVE
jgi:hypothetical protein